MIPLNKSLSHTKPHVLKFWNTSSILLCTEVHYINSTFPQYLLYYCSWLNQFYYAIILFCDSVVSISPTLTDSPVSALLTYWIISLWRNWKRASSAISSQFSQSQTETDRRQTTAVRPELTTGINQLLLQ